MEVITILVIWTLKKNSWYVTALLELWVREDTDVLHHFVRYIICALTHYKPRAGSSMWEARGPLEREAPFCNYP